MDKTLVVWKGNVSKSDQIEALSHLNDTKKGLIKRGVLCVPVVLNPGASPLVLLRMLLLVSLKMSL